MWSCLTVPASLWVWSQKLTSILDLLQTKDQTWTAGNLALQDSLRLKVPVRVVRGSHEKIKCASDQHVYVSAVAALSRCYLADMMIITCQHGRCDSIMCRSGSSFAVIDFVAKHVSCVLCSSLLHAIICMLLDRVPPQCMHLQGMLRHLYLLHLQSHHIC